jgi:hypothetical protein
MPASDQPPPARDSSEHTDPARVVEADHRLGYDCYNLENLRCKRTMKASERRTGVAPHGARGSRFAKHSADAPTGECAWCWKETGWRRRPAAAAR